MSDYQPLDQVPRIGGVPLDTFELYLAAEWRRRLGYAADQRCVCRVVERALLRLALEAGSDRERPHEVDLILAAETARLRLDLLHRDRVSPELSALADALGPVLSRTGLTPVQRKHTVSRITREIQSILRSMDYTVPEPRARWTHDASITHGDGMVQDQSETRLRGRPRPQGRN